MCQAQENGCKDYRASKRKVAATEFRGNGIITSTATRKFTKGIISNSSMLFFDIQLAPNNNKREDCLIAK